MPKRVQSGVRSTEAHSIASGGPRLVPIDPPSSTERQSVQMTAVIKDALIRYYGKLEVAARLMGNMDKSQLSRDLSTGHFRFERLELLDDEGKAFISRALFEAFTSTDPRVRKAQLIRTLRHTLDELAEIEGVA